MLDNIRTALLSVWSNKLRSLLTLLGVVIGVFSVTVLVALGQGLKKDVAGLIQGFGTNVIITVAGKIDTKKSSSQPNPADFINGDILTLQDVKSEQQVSGVEQAVPVSLVSGALKNGDKGASATIFGTYPAFLQAVQTLSISEGKLFTGANSGKVIILGNTVKLALFGDQEAIGKTIHLNNEELEVVGVLGKPKSASVFSSELDNLSLIPFDEATALNKNQVKIVRIIAKANDTADVKKVQTEIQKVVLANHQNQDNFTVLTQDDLLGLFDQFLNIATAMVSAIAAISLVVGGIGIMNIMLVTVTERTREIGLRKAIGATKSDILLQFLTEAVVITAVGGLLGMGLAYLVGLAVAQKTPLHPEFTWQVLLITLIISAGVGIIFGIWPALRAAQKDPIEALRYE